MGGEGGRGKRACGVSQGVGRWRGAGGGGGDGAWGGGGVMGGKEGEVLEDIQQSI